MAIRKLLKYFTNGVDPEAPKAVKIKYRMGGILYEAMALPYDDQYYIMQDGPHNGTFVHILDVVKK
jgi:hypothetical protein